MSYRFVDLFAGMGGMRIPFDELDCECVMSCDWDPDSQEIYERNFNERPVGDISTIPAESVPDHDILLAGFPCQAFSIMGDKKGFTDTRGTLFFEVARILSVKRPRAVVLENVRQLVTHDSGRTLKIIVEQLSMLGYSVQWRILNALDFGLPHKRERVFIVAFRNNHLFFYPTGGDRMIPLSEILEDEVPEKYYASEHVRNRRLTAHTPRVTPSIWHENKAGHISSYPFCCAMRANASYNYLLVNGERRLTPREMLRLLGFPETYREIEGYSKMRRLAGNSVCVPVVRAIAKRVLQCLDAERDDELGSQGTGSMANSLVETGIGGDRNV